MKNNLFLIVGEDNKLIDFSLFKILDNIDYDNNNKIIYDMNNSAFSDILDEASTMSLFSSVKVIIVNNFDVDKVSDDEFSYLEKYIGGKNTDVFIVLICNKIDARKKSYKIFKDNFNIINIVDINDDNICDYVVDRIKSNGYSIDNINLDYFINRVGNDINNINSELDKLFIYKLENKKILKEDIDLLIVDNIDNIIYEFTNAIMDNDYDKIKIMYDKFKKDNVSIDYLLISLVGSFRTSLIIKLLKNRNMNNFEIAKIIGKKEFFVKKTLDRLYGYSINDLKKYINKLALIDKNIKTGKDNIDSFELFIFNKER